MSCYSVYLSPSNKEENRDNTIYISDRDCMSSNEQTLVNFFRNTQLVHKEEAEKIGLTVANTHEFISKWIKQLNSEEITQEQFDNLRKLVKTTNKGRKITKEFIWELEEDPDWLEFMSKSTHEKMVKVFYKNIGETYIVTSVYDYDEEMDSIEREKFTRIGNIALKLDKEWETITEEDSSEIKGHIKDLAKLFPLEFTEAIEEMNKLNSI